MEFDGFRVLPHTTVLGALDYFSFHDGSLYVASLSNGNVFKVVPGASGQPVQQISGAG
ncbi:MAG: hypothetical protein ACRYFU_04630 [Janthinobacterium lividum]